MSDLKFKTIEGHQTLTSEMAFVLYELDVQHFPTPWTERDWRELQNEDRLLIVLEMDKTIVGFCLFDKSPEDAFAHLLKIVVIPEKQGRGLGKQLLEIARLRLVELRCTKFFLEVEHDNVAAQNLYLSCGFEVIHQKKDFYGEGRSALIMTRDEETNKLKS